MVWGGKIAHGGGKGVGVLSLSAQRGSDANRPFPVHGEGAWEMVWSVHTCFPPPHSQTLTFPADPGFRPAHLGAFLLLVPAQSEAFILFLPHPQTLGFALPIVERLLADQAGGQFSVGRGYGRPPSCIIMLPTRELAKQVGLGFGGGEGGGRLFAPLPHPYCPVFLAQANAVRRHN